MKRSINITAALLAALLAFSLTACNGKKPETDPDDPGDEFSGSITEKTDDGEEEQPPIDDGSGSETVTVTTYDQLKEMKRKGSYVLGADIDLTGKEWAPIGTYAAPFEGTFDGAGHKITGLSVTKADEDIGEAISFSYSYCGFFGAIKNATVKDTEFVTASVDVSDYHDYRTVNAGIICGLATDSVISGCTVSGNVKAESTAFISVAGAIAGTIKGTEINSNVSTASVIALGSAVRAEAGGLVGASGMNSSLSDCVSSGDVTASSEYEVAYAGGLIGYCFRTSVTKCSATGDIFSVVTSSDPERGTKGAAYAGGLFGTVSSSSEIDMSVIHKSYSLSDNVTAQGNESSAYASGLSGSASFAEFSECYSVSEINAASDIDNVYASGLITVIDSETLIKGCFCTGDINVNALNKEHVFLGTVSSSFPADISGIIVDSAFRADTVYKVGEVSYSKSDTSVVSVNGSSRTSNVFTTLSLLSQSLGWNEAEWEMSGGHPVPVSD